MNRLSSFFLLTLAVLLAYLTSEVDACCKRKPNFGCCGHGRCNVFCCSCNGGCNQVCERTTCNSGEWLKCAAVIAGCSTPCATGLEPVCVACLGGAGSTCYKCYAGKRRPLVSRNWWNRIISIITHNILRSSASLPENPSNSTEATDEAETLKFEEMADNSKLGISFQQFYRINLADAKINERKRTDPDKSYKLDFSQIDSDNNGYISKEEFDKLD